MIYKYEIACREAGLSEEQIKEIRKIFDNDKKKLKDEKEFRMKHYISFNSIGALAGEYEGDESEVLVDELNLEELVMHRMDLERLDECLNELSNEDREFICYIFEREHGAIKEYSEMKGVPRTTLMSRKKRIIKQLKESFFKKFESVK